MRTIGIHIQHCNSDERNTLAKSIPRKQVAQTRSTTKVAPRHYYPPTVKKSQTDHTWNLDHGTGDLSFNLILHVSELVEISHKLMPKSSPWSRGKKQNIRKVNVQLTLHPNRKRQWYIKLGKSDISKVARNKQRGHRQLITNACGCWDAGMYVRMTTYSKSKDQLGKDDNPARGQLNRENEYFPVPVRA